MRDRNKLTGQEERFDLVVDSNDVILEKVVWPTALVLIQSASLKKKNLFKTSPCIWFPGDSSRWSWWCEPEPAACHACGVSASKDCRFQLESQGWLINLLALIVQMTVFLCHVQAEALCASRAIQALEYFYFWNTWIFIWCFTPCGIQCLFVFSLSGYRLWQSFWDVPTAPCQERCKASAEIQGKSWQQQHTIYSQDFYQAQCNEVSSYM